MFNWFNRVVKDYEKPETYELLVTDTNGDKHSLSGLCASLAKEVVKLEERITKLEAENVELTNCLYEVENRLQAQIDNIHPVVYNLKNNNWDQ
jgi:predicted  nucleic acid-binding Zn-ribbon protein